VAAEPPETDSPDESDLSPWYRSWLLPAVMALLIGSIIVAAIVGFGVRGDGGGAAADETTTTDETTTETRPGGGSAGSPSAFVALRSQDNPIVPPTDEFTELLSLALPPGTYLVFGKVGLHNRDGGAPFLAQCGLVPANEDGTPPASNSELGADWAHLHLGPFGQPGQHGEFPLAVSQVLTGSGSVVLGCSGTGNAHGAFAQYGSIRAIEVDSIDTDLQP
jgi:hypothetical protein